MNRPKLPLPPSPTRSSASSRGSRRSEPGVGCRQIQLRIDARRWESVLPWGVPDRRCAREPAAVRDGGVVVGRARCAGVARHGRAPLGHRRRSGVRHRALGAAVEEDRGQGAHAPPRDAARPRRPDDVGSDPDHHGRPNADRPLGADGGRPAAGRDGERLPAQPGRRPSGSARAGGACADPGDPAPAGSPHCSTRRRSGPAARVRARRPRSGSCSGGRRCRAHTASTGWRLPGGRYRLDFAWPEQQVGLECDGWEHHGTRSAFGKDRARLAELVAAGWRMLPVTWEACTREPERVVRWLETALAAPRDSLRGLTTLDVVKPAMNQSMGTLRTMRPSMRSKISSRLWPVMVRPWLRWPTTARVGSGAWRTSSATDSASSTVPHG